MEKAKEKMVEMRFRVWCQASYEGVLNVPANLSEDERVEYIKDHLDEVPLGELTYLPCSDEVDEEDMDMYEVLEREQDKDIKEGEKNNGRVV